MRLQGQVYGRYIERASLYRGVLDFIGRLRQAGARLSIISHKTQYGHFDEARIDLREAAKSWLVSRGLLGTGSALAVDQVFFEDGREAKLARIAEQRCDIFIDDLPEVLGDPDFPRETRGLWFAPELPVEPTALQPFRSWPELTEAVLAGIASAAGRKAIGGLDARSRHLRSLIVRGLAGGNRGHVGSSMSLVEILRVLYDEILLYDPLRPGWPDRDRCILSKGHGCLALYAILADKGYFDAAELDSFCHVDGMLGGHPERGKVPGVEASTGALGHGLSIGLGMALTARMDARKSRVFVVMGDGEINEGSVWEAALCAGKHRLANLCAIIDYNKIQSAGPTREIQDLEPLLDKWKAFGFAVAEIDGHDVAALSDLFRRLPLAVDRPTAIVCHTVKGKGIPFAENDPEWHHQSKFTPAILGQMRAAVGNS
jgi:transketolase